MSSVTAIMQVLMAKYGDEDGVLNGVPQDELMRLFALQPKGKKAKKAKDPNAPKRAMSGYMLWLNKNRSEIKEVCRGELGLGEGDSVPVTAVTKKAGGLWKVLSEDEKAPFMEEACEGKKRYYEEKSKYSPPSSPEPSCDMDEMPEAPEGWSGPFKMKYLSNVSKEEGKAVKTFKNFEEAVEKATELGENCGGITKTYRGYSLRIGPELKVNPEENIRTGMASWVKGVKDSENEAKDSENEAKDSENEVKKTEKKKRGRPSKKVIDATKAKKEEAKKEEAKKEEAKKEEAKKEEAKKEEAKKEEAKKEEEDEDEDGMEVAEVEYNGKMYYHDESDGIIYDPESGDEVGKMVDGVVVLE